MNFSFPEPLHRISEDFPDSMSPSKIVSEVLPTKNLS